MAQYRLYFFRSPTGEICEVREFEAPDDFAAIAQSKKWRSNEAMELWSGTRKVTRWVAADVESPVHAPADDAAPPPRHIG
jgi:hypothetical protein